MKTLIDLAGEVTPAPTQPERNLVAKLQTDYSLVAVDGGPQSVSNRFTGETRQVSPLVAALIQFVYRVNTGFGPLTYRGKKLPVSLFDRTRYLVLKLDSAAYSSTLD